MKIRRILRRWISEPLKETTEDPPVTEPVHSKPTEANPTAPQSPDGDSPAEHLNLDPT